MFQANKKSGIGILRDYRFPVCILLGAACLWVSLALLYASYCALLNHEFDWDYARYFNMIWNSAHADWFKFMVDDNYLLTHLSFSLILLSPLLHFFDHPFSLYVIQWLMIIGGGIIVAFTGRRHGLSPVFILSLILFYWGYHFTQTTQLDEFHGVAVYFLLIPWLYYCLCYRKDLSWIPFILIIGLREDAAFMILPLLLYMAVREKWRGGYIYSVLALLYGIVALVVLYSFLMKYDPQAHNLTFVRPPSILESLSAKGLKMRATALMWVLIPIAPFLIRGARPILIISSAALIVSMCSAQWRQFYLAYHYPAVVMACLIAGMLEAARQKKAASDNFSKILLAAIPLYLVAVTAFSYYWKGHLPGSREQAFNYRSIDPIGQRALWVARNYVPPDGLLFTTAEWSAFVANRRHLITPETIVEKKHDVDIVFIDLQGVCNFDYLPKLKSGEFGVRFHDNSIFVLQKGFDTSQNKEVVDLLSNPTIVFAWTRKHGGETIFIPDIGLIRYWKGQNLKGGLTIAHGVPVTLEPGEYQAVFRFKSLPPPPENTNMGSLSLHVMNWKKVLASAPIEPGSSEFRTQSLNFKIDREMDVEPRVEGSAAPLWLDNVIFNKAAPAP